MTPVTLFILVTIFFIYLEFVFVFWFNLSFCYLFKYISIVFCIITLFCLICFVIHFLLIQTSVCYLRIFCAYVIASLKCFVDNVTGFLLIYTYMGNTVFFTYEFSHVSICFIISTNNTNIKFSSWYLRFNDISPGVDSLLRELLVILQTSNLIHSCYYKNMCICTVNQSSFTITSKIMTRCYLGQWRSLVIGLSMLYYFCSRFEWG